MKFLRFLVLSVLFVLPFSVFAQLTDSSPSSKSALTKLVEKEFNEGSLIDFVTVNVLPENPGVKELVRISIESSSVDLDKSTITWSVNGKKNLSGIGKTEFSFQTGSSGETTRITVFVTTNKGATITKELSFRPLGITLLWEADTYAPHFYRGKPLISPQAKVKVVAMPDNGGEGANFVYVWQRDGMNISQVSGYGKNTFTTEGPRPYKKLSVGVRASSLDDSLVSETETNLPLSNPFILFYEKDPLLGTIYTRPLRNSFALSKKEFALSAEPYFFSNERGEAPSLQYSWSINGVSTQNPSRSITLRNEGGVKGASDVSLAIRGIEKTFQSSVRNLRVNFGEIEETSRPNF